jgi:hypothetical protein
VAAIPAVFLIDGQGRIVGDWRGAIDLGDVQERIETALAAEADAADDGTADPEH